MEQVKVVFANRSPEDMEIWFLDPHRHDGSRKKLTSVSAGASTGVNSFAGHIMLWVRPRPASCGMGPGVDAEGEVMKAVHIFHGMVQSIYANDEIGDDDEDAEERDPDTCPATWLTSRSPFSLVNTSCENKPFSSRQAECTRLAQTGECQKNPGWMIMFCAKACGLCHLRSPKLRCSREALNLTAVPAFGDSQYGGSHGPALERMLSTLPARVASRYPHVKVTVLSEQPYILRLDNFMTDEEINAVLSTVKPFERSTDQGKKDADGKMEKVVSAGRTSSNSWCRAECEGNPLVTRIVARVEEFVSVPRANFESFQVLEYQLGQKYDTHHDMNEKDNDSPAGPRILTFFLYFSDVEEGGETNFPRLNITVKPQKGSAILWPSVRVDQPHLRAQEPRTFHAALPVVKGLKLAANAWIHLNDFKKPNHWGCTGSFDE